MIKKETQISLPFTVRDGGFRQVDLIELKHFIKILEDNGITGDEDIIRLGERELLAVFVEHYPEPE